MQVEEIMNRKRLCWANNSSGSNYVETNKNMREHHPQNKEFLIKNKKIQNCSKFQHVLNEKRKKDQIKEI